MELSYRLSTDSPHPKNVERWLHPL
ncbi:unnamed protein product [Cuscuta epithymum]|uniref:Uncharacterized protein n=1 Tax=Cuscuta epithymum TaxID=186058 RepID=A0AAV0GL43_9ASTE|nr:unnamed protein product [Cuscuta epithymum]